MTTFIFPQDFLYFSWRKPHGFQPLVSCFPKEVTQDDISIHLENSFLLPTATKSYKTSAFGWGPEKWKWLEVTEGILGRAVTSLHSACATVLPQVSLTGPWNAGKAEGKGIWGKYMWEGDGIFSGCFSIWLYLEYLHFKASLRSSLISRYNLSLAQNFLQHLLQHLWQNCRETICFSLCHRK